MVVGIVFRRAPCVVLERKREREREREMVTKPVKRAARSMN